LTRASDGVGTVRGTDQDGSLADQLLDDSTHEQIGPPEFPVRRWPEQRVVVLVAATLLLTAAFAVSIASEAALDELVVLYVLPVLLAGLELGVTGGVGGAAIAFVLLIAASGRHSELEGIGLAAAATVFLTSGALAGRFSERMRAARYRQERLLSSGLRLARLENLDGLPAVLAEELTQALDLARVEVHLRDAPAVELGTAAGEAVRLPITAHGIEFGSVTLGLAAGRLLTPEDRVVAAKLALQAGVAADNQRLLVAERERAALHAELEQTRTRLTRQLHNVGHILDHQETERREIARQLHEQAAQTMAGVLMGLQVLERDLDQPLTRKQIEEVSNDVRGTLADLRQLAVSVRPPSLDDLGLRAALEGLAEREDSHGSRRMTLQCDACGGELPREVETCAYRVAEDAIQALDGPLILKLNVDHNRNKLRLELEGHSLDQPRLLINLATAHARLELMDGTLQTRPNGTGRTDIIAELPLPANSDD
jgi:signal transduction histidine kinase